MFLTAGVGGVWLVASGCGSGADNESAATSSSTTSDVAGVTTTARPTTTSAGATGTVPRPVGLVRTSWSTDPDTLGSYSYLPAGATPEMRGALAAPLGDKLFFAGEHVSSDSPSTVHGALGAGLDAASAVADALDPGASVVVIGAGISGLAAAHELAKGGFDVTVVESRDRIGGRLDTVKPEGWKIPIERGASWIHDVSASDLPARAKALDVATVEFDYAERVLGSDGNPDPDFEQRSERVAALVERAVEWASDSEEDMTLADALAKSGVLDDTDLTPEEIDTYLELELDTEYGASAGELSAWWGLDEGSEGDDLLVIGGYQRLAADLAEDLEIRTKAAVSAVDWSGESVVTTVSTAETIESDAVVVAVPLGVLKANKIAFSPALDDGHTEAIAALGMGLLDKFWFRFDEQFWSDDTEMWTRLHSKTEPFAEWFNLAPVTGEPVLLSLMGGPLAREWANKSDEEVTDAAMASLQQFIDAGW